MRISTTIVEDYRRLLQAEYQRDTAEEELIAKIKGTPFEPTWQMRAGKAWHSIIETPDAYERTYQEAGVQDQIYYEYDGFRFDAGAVKVARERIGPGLWEVKGTRRFTLSGQEVTVVAQADHMHGLFIQDNKATWSNPGAFDYEPSLQWRFYLLVHAAASFTYNKFAFREPKDGYCELHNLLSFRFWTYPDIETDCRRWLALFLAWAESRGLSRYLEREGTGLQLTEAA